MEAFTRVTGVLAPLDRSNVDTDQIIPKQFLKRIERSGFGPFLFYDWRRNGEFILDTAAYRGASVLVTGENFGCGSSREHAAWSLLDAGFRVVIAPSFGDIFKSNSFRSGLLPVELPDPQVAELIRLATEEPGMEVTVDLAAQRIVAGGFETSFTIDPFYRECLLNGWDEVALTLRQEAAIARYETARSAWLPAAMP
ncbi:MAG TPA: 3-isopropylmalate dehydratase small subunit [Candidatus Dormibacteraeota bacterium]|nr:3-isopropylmalate dehydratase small subunit [Candidatus Dormibacteraeota bacterium]